MSAVSSAIHRKGLAELNGTWTPTLTTTGTDFTSVTYDEGYRVGVWYRIGSLVYIQGQIGTDAITVGSASGNLIIGGLPYAAAAQPDSGQSIAVGYSANFSGTNPTSILIPASQSYLSLYDRATSISASAAMTFMDVSSIANRNIVAFGGYYFTDDA